MKLKVELILEDGKIFQVVLPHIIEELIHPRCNKFQPTLIFLHPLFNVLNLDFFRSSPMISPTKDLHNNWDLLLFPLLLHVPEYPFNIRKIVAITSWSAVS
ncbi:100aa long hypothetical protein [Pyrococcus horikoshii OT3]|uniref:Uncharacterized protein n=1 Tax=Pyrococcus horikoshii (strain ATCC 700860 / DSM 12428 / JCM 9974 / NBRC 100139 / OT-3) TaxID=70601 RepID=O58566_PYRHO|nr:100aa long hypothetical protein [Pyrococcus horikoshii OT3]